MAYTLTDKKVVDVSHHNDVNWDKAKDELALAVIRVQYGSSMVDRLYKSHVAGAKANGIPFGHYAYGRFVSIADAVQEANDFMARADKDAEFLVLDTEDDTLDSCGARNIAAASQAFIDTCRAAGWRTGFYVAHHMYNKYGLNKVQADFLWVPRYNDPDDGIPNGAKPAFPCDIWQFTESGKLTSVTGGVDINMLMTKDISWFLKEQPKPTPAPKQIGVAKVTASLLNVRKEPNANAPLVGKPLAKGSVWKVYAEQDGWYNVGIGWICGDFVSFTDGNGIQKLTGYITVTATALNVRKYPDVSAPEVRDALPKGSKWKVYGLKGDWYSVGIGWVHKKYVIYHAQ